MKEKKDLSIQVLHIQSWGRPAPRGRGDPHTALRCPVSKERDGFPKGGGRRRCAISGAGLTLSRSRKIASPVGEIFRKKTDEGFFRASRGLPPPPPQGRAHARQPRTTLSILLPTLYSTEAHCKVTTHYPLHSPPYSLLFHPSLEGDLPSKVGELLEERVDVLCLGELM